MPIKGQEQLRSWSSVAGLAGLRTVEELRTAGFAGEITMIGAETQAAVRPAAAVQAADGRRAGRHLAAGRARLARCAGQARRAGRAASAGAVGTDQGETVRRAGDRDRRAAVALPGPGRQRFLRTIDDALGCAGCWGPGAAGVVGAGWIGAELATAAAARGCAVHRAWRRPPRRWPSRSALRSAPARPAWYARPALSCGWASASSRSRTAGSPGRRGLAGRRCGGDGGRGPARGRLARVARAWTLDNGVAVDEQLRSSVPGVFAVGRLRRVLVGQVRAAAAHRALGRRAAGTDGAGGEPARRQRAIRPGSVFLVRAVRPDAAVRRLTTRGADRRSGAAIRRAGQVGGVLAGRSAADRRAHRRPAQGPACRRGG